MFKFIHAADIHLDSPLEGLPAYEGAPLELIRGATRQALNELVHVALDEEVDFVLIAGDVYDGDWKDHNTGLYFVKQMARLRDADIPVFLIAGNHDAQSVMTRKLQLPDNVHRFPTKKAGTVHLEDLGVAIHGQGFASKAVTTDLSANYPQAISGAYNIGLLHTSLTGYEGHGNYAPCTVAGLAHLDYDYWALGHIHQRDCIQHEHPAIWFSGNIQGRHIRESGPKGCNVVTVDDRGDHTVDFQALDVVRWETVTVDVSECDEAADVTGPFAEHLEHAPGNAGERILAIRVVLIGETALHEELVARPGTLLNELRAAAITHGGDSVYVEKLKVRTSLPRQSGDGDDDGPLAMLHDVVEELKSDAEAQEKLKALFDPLRTKLPAEVAGPAADLDLSDPDVLRALLDESEPIIRTAWRDGESGP